MGQERSNSPLDMLPGSDDDDLDEEEEEEEEGDTGELYDKSNSKKEAADSDQDTPITIFAKQWIADGRLPSDFKITSKTTEEDIDKALYDYKLKNISDQKINDYISENGLSKEDIAKLRGQRLGIDTQQYDKANAYNQLSEYQFDEDDNDYEKDVKDYLSVYYREIKIPANKIERTINDDLDSNDLGETLKEAKKYFKEKGENLTTSLKNAEEEKIKDNEDRITQRINKEKELLSKKTISGKSFTESEIKFIEDALYNNTETVTRKDGTAVKTTLYNKMIAEMTNDQEKALLTKALFILQDFKSDNPEEKAAKGILKQLTGVLAGTHNIKNNKVSMREIS